MKIVYINSAYGGSTGKIVRDLMENLPSSDQAYFFYGYGSDEKTEYVEKIGNKFEMFFDKVFTKLFDIHGLNCFFATKKLISKLKEIQPDVVHLHNLHGHFINYKMLFEYLKTQNIKIVWTLHDCWAFTGHCAYFDMAKCEKWKTQCKNCPNKKRYPSSVLFDHSNKNFKIKKQLFAGCKDLTIVTPSKWLANLVGQSFLKDYKTIVINNGINLGNFKIYSDEEKVSIKNKFQVAQTKKIAIGVASPFGERKGYDDFIKLSKLIDDSKWQIVMVGLQKTQLANLPKNIVGIAKTDNQIELAKLYSCASIFLNLTYEDNFPTTNIESLACGTPILTYKTGGSVESVDESNGFVVEQGDIREVNQVLSNFDRCKFDSVELSNNAKKMYERKVFAEKYMELY